MKTFIRRVSARLSDPHQLLLLLAMGLYTGIFAGLAIRQHQGMRTHKADMGQIDQAVWNSSRGRFVEMTDFGFLATRMTDHVEPILALISPIYWIWDDPRAILILQTLFVAAGAWILYHLTLHHFQATLEPGERDKIWYTDALLGLARPIALALACAYLLAPPLQAAILTEFHAVPLSVPLVLWALWSVETRRWRQFPVALILVAIVKEETALLAAGLGLWAVWRAGIVPRWSAHAGQPAGSGPLWLAGGLTVAALVWFYVATFVIVPYHAQPVYGIAESGYFARYGALGDSPADILRSFFTRPGLVWEIATEPVRLDYLRRMLMPFGFIPLLAPEVFLLSLPVLLANQLSAYPAQYYGEYHYSAPVIVYFAGAAALGAARLWRLLARLLPRTSTSFQHLPAARSVVVNLIALVQNSRTALRPLVAGGLALWFLAWGILGYVESGRGPGGPRLDAAPVTEHHRLLPRFTAQIPPQARVTATAAVHPHVSHRRFVYQFPMGLDAPTPPEQQADWALLNVTMAVDMAPGDLRAQVESMLAGEWGVVDAADGFLLLHKGAPEKNIPHEFFSFVDPLRHALDDLEPPKPLSQPVATLGLLQSQIIDRPYWRSTQIVSDWQTGAAFDGEQQIPRVAVHLPGGDVVDSNINQTAPGLVWQPPHTWQPGQQRRVTTLPHFLPGIWGIVAEDEQGTRLVAAYHRGPQDVLAALPLGPVIMNPESPRPEAELVTLDQVAARLELQPAAPARFAVETGEIIHLRAWVSTQVYPGGGVHVLLAWDFSETAETTIANGNGQAGTQTHRALWPADLNVFVHLRAGEENLDQSDGRPRYFIEGAGHGPTTIWDWRQLAPSPEQSSAEQQNGDEARASSPIDNPELQLVIGLYDPQTGRRASVVGEDGSPFDNEHTLGTVRWIDPPLPDQTCALIPETCAAQP